MGLRKVKGFLEWLYNTEVYKNEKLWSLLCSIVPNLGVFISIVFSVFEKRARSKIDKKNQENLKKLAESYELRLKEKDAIIKKLKRSNEQCNERMKIYESRYEKLKAKEKAKVRTKR